MDYCSMDQAQQQHPSPYSSALGQHHGSFSSVTSAGSAPSYDAYTPISSRSSSITDQRLDPVTSLDYDHCAATSAAFSNVSLDLTPPPSATAPSFFMSVPGVSGAEMAGNYLSSSSFPQPPATPDRHGSISSSQSTAPSPNSPAHVLSSSYPSSISSMSSVASAAAAAAGRHGHPGGNAAMMCGPGTPDAAYPLTDVPRSHQQHHQQHHQVQHQQHHQHAQHQHFQHQQHKDTPPYMFPTPPPQHGLSAGDCGEISPSEFYWQSHVRPDSPIATFFDERPQMALPPPSATLKSSVVKRESAMDEATAAAVAAAEEEDMLRRYSVASSASSSTTPTPMRRRMIMDNAAQMKTVALQQRLGGQGQQQHHHQQHPHMQHHQQRAPSYGSYYSAANAVTAAGVCHDNIITRNGIQVSKVASGAFKCIVPGCPSRPFKRSEHLKRHVMTHHESRDLFPCEFCGRTFNRKDNWRSHLKLHTVIRGKNARTDYFAKAVHMYEDEMRKVSKSRPRKERTHRV